MTQVFHHFKRGDNVAVFNSTMNGEPLFEGWATIVDLIDVSHQYSVRFHRLPGQEAGPYDRFVWPGECQDDPEAWLAKAQQERLGQQRPNDIPEVAPGAGEKIAALIDNYNKL